MKKFFLLTLVLALIVSMVACNPASTSNEPPKESKFIMFASVLTGGGAWGPCQKGFEDALAEIGWTGQYVSPTNANDIAAIVDLGDTAVTNKADGIITLIMPGGQSNDFLARAKEADIPVVSVNTYATPEQHLAWIGTDPVNMGKVQADVVLRAIESGEYGQYDNITACYIQTLLSAETQNQQFAAFSEVIKEKYPNAVLIQDESNSDAAQASDKVAALLKTYPEMNAIVAADGYGCPGIANYIQGEGLQDKIAVIGLDDTQEALNYVRSGVLYCTVAQDFYKMGYQAVYFLKDYFDGKTVPYANDSGAPVITAENLDEHIALMQSRGVDLQ